MGNNVSLLYKKYNDVHSYGPIGPIFNTETDLETVLKQHKETPGAAAVASAVAVADAAAVKDVANLRKELNSTFDRLKSNFEMYMLYDNYDKKNNTLIQQLKKKVDNQNKELKQLIEDRDKLKTLLENDITTNTSYHKNKNILIGLNIILFIIFVILIVAIIYRILTYPHTDLDFKLIDDKLLKRLIGIKDSDLQKFSNNELKKLNSIVESKIDEIKHNSI